MKEKIASLITQLEGLDEELGDLAIESLSAYLQSVDETPNVEQMAKVKQLEKSISKAQRALQKAKAALEEV